MWPGGRSPAMPQWDTLQPSCLYRGPRVLVAVTDKGLWWTFVPTQVDMVAWYTWHQSTTDVPFSEFISVCRISDDFSIAVAGVRRDFRDRILEGGVLIGRWTGAGFTYTPASLPAGTQLELLSPLLLRSSSSPRIPDHS